MVQVVVVGGGAQVGKALLDGLISLGGDPQPFGRLLPARLLHDPPGYQFSLTAGVGGDDQIADVAPAHLGLYRPELPPGLRNYHRFHSVGQHGQSKHIPLGPSLVIVLRGRQLHQMAQGPGDNVALPLQKALAGLFAAQHTGQFPRYRGLFRQYQCFSHIDSPNRR